MRVTGYEQFTGTDLDTAQTLAVPTNSNYAIFDVVDQDIRWKAGATPTASVGGLMKAGSQYEHSGKLDALELIAVVTGAELNVTYYHRGASDK